MKIRNKFPLNEKRPTVMVSLFKFGSIWFRGLGYRSKTIFRITSHPVKTNNHNYAPHRIAPDNRSVRRAVSQRGLVVPSAPQKQPIDAGIRGTTPRTVRQPEWSPLAGNGDLSTFYTMKGKGGKAKFNKSYPQVIHKMTI